MNLTISSQDYDDLKLFHGNQVLNELLGIARVVINNGGKVIIQSEYINAPPEIVRIFSTHKDLAEWEAQIAQATERANAMRAERSSGKT